MAQNEAARVREVIDVRQPRPEEAQVTQDIAVLRHILEYLISTTENLINQAISNISDENLRRIVMNGLDITVGALKKIIKNDANMMLISSIAQKYFTAVSLYLLATGNVLLFSYWIADRYFDDASEVPEVIALKTFLKEEQYFQRYEAFTQKFENILQSSHMQATEDAIVIQDMAAFKNELNKIEIDIKSLRRVIDTAQEYIRTAINAISNARNLDSLVPLISKRTVVALALSGLVGYGFYIGAHYANKYVSVDLHPKAFGGIMAAIPPAGFIIHHEKFLKKLKAIHIFVLDIHVMINIHSLKLAEIEEHCERFRH